MLVALALAFTLLRPPPTSGPFGRDFEAYYAAGLTANAGGDPYSRDIWRGERTIAGVDTSHDELLPFVGPPASLPMWSLFARLPQPVALRIWIGVLIGAYLFLIASALALARAPRNAFVYVLCAGFAFASGPIVSDIALGQVALLSAAALGGSLLAYRARRPAGAIAATLLAAIQPNLVLPLIARMRSRWSLVMAASAAGLFSALTFITSHGAAGIAAYAVRLRAHGDAERFVTIQDTPTAIAYAFGASESAAIAYGWVLALTAVIATIAAILRERLRPTSAALLAIAMLPLAMPFFHEHDFVLELIPAIVLAVNARGRTRALAAVATILVMVDWFGFAQRPPAHAQLVAFALATAFGFAGLGPLTSGARRYGFTGVLTVVALVALVIPLARTHPAPTWPDMLPSKYHAPAAADASTVWGDEQRRAGLQARDPIWGALRTLPLGGCLLLGGAILLHARKRRSFAAHALDIDGQHIVERRRVVGVPVT
ncbi:MAG: hypothetical protein NVS3B28_11650 [Candidatus Velthaea sp.]